MKLEIKFLAITAFVLSGLAFAEAQSSGTTYSALEAAKHVGETATVADKVDSVYQSKNGNIFLNMGGKYPNEAFTAFIPAKAAIQFANYKDYEGKTVSVSGKITLYHVKPEIIVTSTSQISAR